MAKADFSNVAPECWTRLKEGDPAALGELYDCYVDKLFLAASAMTSDRELVKDSLQEVFIEIWHYRETIGHIQYPQAYLTKVLRSILIKKLKKKDISTWFPLEETLAGLEGNREDTIISSDTDKELKARLSNALAKLSVRQKLILKFHFYEGLTYEQIAQRLNMKYQSVNNLAFRTIRHLRDIMMIFFL
ncbi:MAG: sigma-70 family RNA polymerase sigma factor [Chitinophagaceae bacterium]|nr:sigma-70 family RNA polymerase sigma factor [Chitinophagaceae bacterium]